MYKELKPVIGNLQVLINTVGTVMPQNRLELLPTIAGRIDKILVVEGTRVQRGQTLALMSSTDRAALLDAARLQGSEKIKYWENVYKPTPIISPISGQIIVRNTEPGQTVNSNTVILVLADRLIVKAQVDETDIGRLKLSQKVKIALDAYPDQIITGHVAHISYESTVVNNVTTYEVDILPDRVPAFFRSGMSAKVDIIQAEKKNIILIPEMSLQYRENENQVRIKDDSALGSHLAKVETGIRQDAKVEILSGVSTQDILLIQSTRSSKKNKSSGSFIRPATPRPSNSRNTP